ncbi:MAG: hypothetical protein QOF92_2446 [Pseudonocardiales bacterium]|nr:hypothetical protein [Pseudonocardiales bacterium]
MTTKYSRPSSPAPHRISGPGELLQAVPYLLGFHPRSSLVLVGLAAGELVVTARLDLVDTRAADVVGDTIEAMQQGGSSEFIAAVYDDGCEPDRSAGPPLPWSSLACRVGQATAAAGCEIVDVLLVCGQRWWSFTCESDDCCPPEGRVVPDEPSAFTAAATYAGVVALPDRSALAAILDPLPDEARDALSADIAAAENASVAAVLDGQLTRHQRSVKRAIFAAARSSGAPRWSGLPDVHVTRFGVALSEIDIRDSVWMAIDDGRLDGRALWRDLARRLPAPYDAAPLFLFGWAAWRAGDGALAGIAAERAVLSDSEYSAADLLLAALSRGLDPRRFPKLRLPRSA